MRVRYAAMLAGVSALVIGAGTVVSALTADEVMNQMNNDQRTGFMSGAVDMAAQLHAENGDRAKAECALAWFFHSDDGLRDVFDFFDIHGEHSAVALISVLINRKCDDID